MCRYSTTSIIIMMNLLDEVTNVYDHIPIDDSIRKRNRDDKKDDCNVKLNDSKKARTDKVKRLNEEIVVCTVTT